MRRSALALAWVLAVLPLASAAQEAHRLAGRAVDVAGRGLASVKVSIVSIDGAWSEFPADARSWPDRVLATATTGEDGAFSVDAARVPKGLHALLVEAPGRAPLLRDAERIAFGPGALPPGLEITLPRTGAVAGIVLDDAGRPGRQAALRLVAKSPLGTSLVFARAGDDGRFLVEGLPSGASVLVSAESGSASARADTEVPLSGASRVALHLRPPREVAGVVVAQEAEPKPVAGARIVVVSSLGGRTPWMAGGDWIPFDGDDVSVLGESATGPDGSFRVSAPESAMVTLFEPGFAPRPLGPGRNVVRRVAPATGRVMRGDQPVSGVRVRLEHHRIETTTASDGRFVLPFAEGQVRAIAPSGATARATLRGASLSLSLSLPRTTMLRLRVVAPPTADAGDERPVPGAVVRIAGVDARWHVVTATDADGRAAVELAVPPTRVAATSGDLAARLDLGGAPAEGELRLVMAPAAVLAPAVTSGGRPVAGAIVVVAAQDGPRAPAVATTDAAGSVRLVRLAPGPHQVVVAAERTLGATTTRMAVPPALQARAPNEPIDLPLAGRLRVRCVDSEGRPVEGVAILARSGQGRDPRLARFGPSGRMFGLEAGTTFGTGADGIAAIEGFAPGECIQLSASRPGLAPRDVACARPETVAPGGVAPMLDLILERGATVHGVVLGPDGAAVPLAKVQANADSATATASGDPRQRMRAWARPLASTTADSSGAFVLRDVRAGRVELVAMAEGLLPSEPVPADVLAGDDVEIDLSLRAGATIRGTVRTASGAPADGAAVGAAAERGGRRGPLARFRGGQGFTQSGADGTFAIEGLDPEVDWTVEAWMQGDHGGPLVVRAGGEPVTLVLSALGRIEGRVLGVEDLATTVQVRCTGAPSGESEAMADPDGTFVLGGLAAGTWSCRATAGESGEGSVEGLVVKEGETTPATIRLGPRVLQEILVRDAVTGEPIPGATAWCWRESETTDLEGRATLALEAYDPAASPTVGARATGYQTAQVVVPTPRPALLELRLSSSSVIRGIVVDADGQPVAGIEVFGARATATTGPDGRFEMTPWGRETRVSLRAERAVAGLIEKGSVDVELGPTGADGVTLRLERVATGSALVVVVDGSGPLPGAQVMLMHESVPQRRDVQDARAGGGFGQGQGASGVTDTEGSFLTEGLRVGEFTILVGRADEPTVRAAGTVDVAAGSVAQATVRVPAGLALTGRVVRGSEPVAGARVAALASGGVGGRVPGGLLAAGASGADGTFELGPFPEGLDRVTIAAESPSREASGDRVVELEATVGGPPLTLDVQGVSLAGQVVADGEPAAGVAVEAREENGRTASRARTLPNGSYVLRGLSPGARYDVSASLAGRAPAATVATAPATGMAIIETLELGGSELVGTATAVAGTLGDSFQLALARASGARLPVATVSVQPGGAWRCAAPSGERLAYRASASGLASVLGVTEPGEPLALVFPAGAELTLEITEADGRPAPGATARLVSWNGRPADDHLIPSRLPSPVAGWMGRSNEEGLLVLAPVTAGACVLAVEREGRRVEVTATLADGDRQRLPVRLPVR